MKNVKANLMFTNISMQPKLAFEWLARTKQKPSQIRLVPEERMIISFSKIGEDYLQDFVDYLIGNDSIRTTENPTFEIIQ